VTSVQNNNEKETLKLTPQSGATSESGDVEVDDSGDVEVDEPGAFSGKCSWLPGGLHGQDCANALEDLANPQNKTTLNAAVDILNESTHNIIASENVPSYIFSQVAMNKGQCQHCMSFCGVCDADENGQQKTIHVHRFKSFYDKAKMIGLSPVDAIAGALGNVDGSNYGVIQGARDTIKYSALAGAYVTQTVAGTGTHVLTGAVIGGFVGVPLALVGGVAGGLLGSLPKFVGGSFSCPTTGLTQRFTRCGRLGFVKAQGGEVTSTEFSSKWFGGSGLEKLQEEETDNPKDIEALQHCKHLTSFNFDMRHMAECLKHTDLCGQKGGFVAPRTDRHTCVAASGKNKTDIVKDLIPATFNDADESTE